VSTPGPRAGCRRQMVRAATAVRKPHDPEEMRSAVAKTSSWGGHEVAVSKTSS
jgi:hypothetical protein